MTAEKKIAHRKLSLLELAQRQEKGTIDSSMSTLFSSKWLTGTERFTNRNSIISAGYEAIFRKKSAVSKNRKIRGSQKHIILKAIQWKKMLDDGEVSSLSQIAKKEGLTRARVTQGMNLVKLPPAWREFLVALDDPEEIRRYSEKKLRNYRLSNYTGNVIQEDSSKNKTV